MTDNPTCQHLLVDNATWRCVACDEHMIAQSGTASTVLSAPNLGACTNPACHRALATGTYSETNPPAGCTNPGGNYIPDRARERTVVLGWDYTYECERCGNDGTLVDSRGVTWDCGHHHRGEYEALS